MGIIMVYKPTYNWGAPSKQDDLWAFLQHWGIPKGRPDIANKKTVTRGGSTVINNHRGELWNNNSELIQSCDTKNLTQLTNTTVLIIISWRCGILLSLGRPGRDFGLRGCCLWTRPAVSRRLGRVVSWMVSMMFPRRLSRFPSCLPSGKLT